MKQHVDFSRIPTRHDGINRRLEQWARWRVDHHAGGNVSPMFRLYRSKARQWEMPIITAQASPRDNLEIERAVVKLPRDHMTSIIWAYGNPWVPVSAIRFELGGVTRDRLAEMLNQARDMIISILKQKLVDMG